MCERGSTIEELKEAKRFVSCVFQDERLLDVYRWGDRKSWQQTKHGIEHANQVKALTIRLAETVNQRYPERLDPWTQHVVAPLGAFLHDVGRAIDVAKHDVVGARWANEFLRKCSNWEGCRILPDTVVDRVVRIIECHRANRFCKMRSTDPALDLVVLADKCIGDEDRVRWGRWMMLEGLRWANATWIPEYVEHLKNGNGSNGLFSKAIKWIPVRKGSVHDRINFAIKHCSLDLDHESEDLVLRLTLKNRVCQPGLIYGNDYYREAYWACSRAAKHLGFQFRLEFNGVRYVYDDFGAPPCWKPVNSIVITRGV